MQKKRWVKPVALLLGASLVAAACGDDDSKGATSTTASSGTTTAGSTSSAGTTANTATTTAVAGSTTASAATTAAGTSGFGQDPTNKNIYKGPGDFTIDLSKCPSDYNPTQGITDKEIDLFLSLPKSGPLAGFGLLADGSTNYFNYINDNGGIGGRKIVLDTKDDAYEPAKTQANVNEAIQSKKYAALYLTLGTPNNLQVWDQTNKECMPHLLNGTGAAQWGDVTGHPWTTGMQLDYFTEARLWVEWMKGQFPNGAKVAALTFNSDFGKSYSKGLKAGLQGTNLTLVKEEFHEATAPNVTNNITTLLAANPDVVVLQTSGAFCTQGMAELEKAAYKGKVMISGTCGSLTQFFKPLLDQGLTGNGVYIVQNFKDVNDPAFANEDTIKLFHQVAKAGGLDDKQSTYGTAWIFAIYMVDILKRANALPGGLTRPNIMIAARSIDLAHPLLLNGLKGHMEGTKDAYLTEGGRIAQMQGADAGAKTLGAFKPVSDIINLEGKLGTYATVANFAG